MRANHNSAFEGFYVHKIEDFEKMEAHLVQKGDSLGLADQSYNGRYGALPLEDAVIADDLVVVTYIYCA